MWGKRLDVLYDGGCALCVRSLRLMKRADPFGTFRLVDTQGRDWRARFPQIRAEETAEAIIVVTESGEVLRGFYAFRRMLWSSPWLLPLIAVFYFPGAALIGPRLYGWIARNRRRLGCRAGACESPSSDR